MDSQLERIAHYGIFKLVSGTDSLAEINGLEREDLRDYAGFPAADKFGITSQMRRAVTSIPANIAEGQARRGTGEFLQALGIARGSLAELETFVILCERLEYLSPTNGETLLSACVEINKMLHALMRSLETRK